MAIIPYRRSYVSDCCRDQVMLEVKKTGDVIPHFLCFSCHKECQTINLRDLDMQEAYKRFADEMEFQLFYGPVKR